MISFEWCLINDPFVCVKIRVGDSFSKANFKVKLNFSQNCIEMNLGNARGSVSMPVHNVLIKIRSLV